jgi:hypothetical protein
MVDWKEGYTRITPHAGEPPGLFIEIFENTCAFS